jgi:hypothetical protein
LTDVVAWYIQNLNGNSFRSVILRNVLAAAVHNFLD